MFFVVSLFLFLFLYKGKTTGVYFNEIISNKVLNIIFHNTHDTMNDVCTPSLLNLNEDSWRKV